MRKVNGFILVIILIAGIGILMATSVSLFKVEDTHSSQTALVMDQLLSISEWTSLKYEYSNVIISRTEKSLSLLGFTEINYAEAIKLIKYSAYIKVGTDMSQVELTYKEDSNELYVRLPKAKVLDHVVETEKTKVEDIKGEIFSEYPTQLVLDEINSEKERILQEKLEGGILEEADKRMERLIIDFLKDREYTSVIVEFY